MRKLAIVLALVLLPLATARAQFCPGVSPFVFSDVLASDPFCGSITFLAQNNVTLGCLEIDANNRLYCPADSVRRDQMAAFMFRLNNALFPTTCAPGQVRKWNGLAWTCADDNIGGSGGGGTVTSVAANNGLQATPSTITGAGVIGIAPAFRLPQSCANGQVAKSSGPGGAWACGNDVNSGGTLTSLTQGSGIVLTPNPITTSGTIAADTAFLQRRVTGTCPVGSSIRVIDAAGNVTCEADDVGPANAYVQGGNAFGATAVLGTNDNQALDVRVNGARVMRYEPNAISPNVIGGSPANNVTATVRGATIGGGGVPAGINDPEFGPGVANRVTDAYGTVGGGYGNRAGDDLGTTSDRAFATVAGGDRNVASGWGSFVGGGDTNAASGGSSVIGGGGGNFATGHWSAIGGGIASVASGPYSSIAGGITNFASAFAAAIGGGMNNQVTAARGAVVGGEGNQAAGVGATVAGGGVVCLDPPVCSSTTPLGNRASGTSSIVLGGIGNVAGGTGSLAGGSRARVREPAAAGNATGDSGTFLWADASEFTFDSIGSNEFAARATGGVRFVTAINGTGVSTATFAIAPDGKVGVNTATPSPEGTLTIRDATNPSIFIQNTTNDLVESGRIRFSEGTAQSNCRGAYLHLDGSANRFNVGVHATSDCDTANDIAAIQISRGNGFVGFLTVPSGTNPIVAGSNASNGNGANLTPTGIWTNASSRTFKEGFEPVDARDVLERVAAMPISAWRYAGDAARHIGPTAEDFRASFGLGGDERYIGTVDADGVALAAIQGLNAKVEAQTRELDAQRAEIATLRRLVEQLIAAR